MTIWAIADLHLAKSVPSKDMGIFGPTWQGYMDKIEKAWKESVQPQDLVLIPGDISWAMTLTEALIDLQWIDTLPGTKVMIKGNHDYWWSSLSKMEKVVPPSIHLIHNNIFCWEGVEIGGTRLWDTSEYNFHKYIDYQENIKAKPKIIDLDDQEKIFNRELERLSLSLQNMSSHAKIRIALTHYPPISAELMPSKASCLLEQYGINYCVFGHLHTLKLGQPLFGKTANIHYILASADYLNFHPICIL
jgi:predicted phosphohydrolase